MLNKIELNSLSFDELEKFIEELGEKRFRAKQIFSWLHSKMVNDFDEMNNIPKSLKEKLDERSKINTIKILRKYTSSKDNTSKYLFCLSDNNIIESVLMQYKHGYAVCISSQVGCRMGCAFCASTIGGLERNLTCAEMLEQIYVIQKDCKIKISNVVIMGSGEPLENFNALLTFLKNINCENGQNISLRNITVSTCGLVDKIIKLADEKLQITLAISLHAPNDEIRRQIMPVANKYKMNELLKSCKYYTKCTNRRITFEYALIRGINDSDKCALELADKLRGLLAHVNLIPINDVKERNFTKSSRKIIERFAEILKRKNINVTIRRELGSDINAACGQLRKNYINK